MLGCNQAQKYLWVLEIYAAFFINHPLTSNEMASQFNLKTENKNFDYSILF